eukprot:gene116-302_t
MFLQSRRKIDIIMIRAVSILPGVVIAVGSSSPHPRYITDLVLGTSDSSTESDQLIDFSDKTKSCLEKSEQNLKIAKVRSLPHEFHDAVKDAETRFPSDGEMSADDLAQALDRHPADFDAMNSCDRARTLEMTTNFLMKAPNQALKRLYHAMVNGTHFRLANETKLDELEIGNVNILQSPEHKCSDGSPYWFGIVPAKGDGPGGIETKKIAVEFMGSGGCFNQETCNLCPNPTAKGMRERLERILSKGDTTNITKQIKYIFFGPEELPKMEQLIKDKDFENLKVEHNFANIVSQRSCFDIMPWIFKAIGWWSDFTPPSFLWNKFFTAPYETREGSRIRTNQYGGVDFHHHGWFNARYVLSWIKERFPQAERFYVHGFSAGAVGLSNHVEKLVEDYPKAQFRILSESGVFFPEYTSSSEQAHKKDITKLRIVMASAWKDPDLHDCPICHEPDKIYSKLIEKFSNKNNVRLAMVESAFDPTHYWYNRAMRILGDQAPLDGDTYFTSKVKFFDELLQQARSHPNTFYGFVHHQQGHVLGRGMCSMNIPPSVGQMWYKDWWASYIRDELKPEDAFQLAFFKMDDPQKPANIQDLLKGWGEDVNDFFGVANDHVSMMFENIFAVPDKIDSIRMSNSFAKLNETSSFFKNVVGNNSLTRMLANFGTPDFSV